LAIHKPGEIVLTSKQGLKYNSVYWTAWFKQRQGSPEDVGSAHWRAMLWRIYAPLQLFLSVFLDKSRRVPDVRPDPGHLERQHQYSVKAF